MTVRYYVPGQVHHIIVRLADRRFYMSLDGARARYLKLFGAAMARSDWSCLAYALMSNHIHLLLVAGIQTPDSWLRRVHPPFVKWLNGAHAGLGTVLAGRPSMHIVDDDEVSTKIAYVHNNPVRAGVVKAAIDSSWTSHRAYAGVEKPPSWLNVAEGMRRSGYEDASAFDRWVGLDTATRETSHEAERMAQRVARLAHRRGALEACTPVSGPSPHVPLAARPFGHIRAAPRDVVNAVCFVTNASIDVVRSRRREGVAARVLVLVAGASLGLTASELCAALGLTRQAGSKLLLRRGGQVDHDLVKVVTTMLSTDRWSEKVDRVSNEHGQERGMFASGKGRG